MAPSRSKKGRKRTLVEEMDPPRSTRPKRQAAMKSYNSRAPVVMLTRLPDSEVDPLRQPTPQQYNSEVDSPSSSDNDMPWEPENNSSDSDFLPENDKLKAAKCPKIEKTMTVATKKPSAAVCPNANKTASAAAAKATAAVCPKMSKKTESTTKTASTTATTTPAASLPSTTNSNSKPTAANSPIIISSVFSHGSQETTNVRPKLPEVELKLDMVVLARRRPMKWHQGKIIEIVEKEGGRLKYKVSFGEMGRSLVSAHHLALSTTPKLEQLYVGARVVIQSQDDKTQFHPGVLAELPGRKNRLRFLVFLDDHTPMYVGLQLLHLICKPLENTLDDLPDGRHKIFLTQYLKNWPYPHLTQYKIGQCINVELEGTLQKCKVETVDCSLMEVVFQESQQKDWIYRGSMRLEHMAKFLALREKQQNNEKSSQ
ncbi:histone-lysine N-methyltransferase SETDB1-B-like [Salarias fasciatus]|uniref:histone-lysine N-methyltransferase SETDB1-B-like n=1 Tax=Salarias fasciatus TaxID=181472 RepID=UPI001176A27B|nr:histone-lysine N-methyltransferase SETDB1-B-like [Salarias fasciatus]